MHFCPLSPTLPASKSANKSPRICYECSLSPSCRADARGVLIREKLGRAHARFLTAKSLKKPRPPRRGKNLLSGICLSGCNVGALADVLRRHGRLNARSTVAHATLSVLRLNRRPATQSSISLRCSRVAQEIGRA